MVGCRTSDDLQRVGAGESRRGSAARGGWQSGAPSHGACETQYEVLSVPWSNACEVAKRVGWRAVTV